MTTKDTAVKAVTATQIRITDGKNAVIHRINARADAGQTSVEYLGIIAVVVLIVLAITGTPIGQLIYQKITEEISRVAG